MTFSYEKFKAGLKKAAVKQSAEERRSRLREKLGHKFTFKPVRACRSTRGQGLWKLSGRTPSLLLKIHAGGRNGDQYSVQAERAQHIDSNMLGRTPDERQAEWALDIARHPNSKPANLFIHLTLSRPSNQNLTIDQWKKCVQLFLEKIGADGNFTLTRHSDTAHDHCHLVFSLSKRNGELVSLSNNRWSWRAAIRSVELALGLVEHPAPIQQAQQLRPTSDASVSAHRRAMRLGTQSPLIETQAITDAVAASISMKEFRDTLLAMSIDVKESVKNGRVTGILFKQSAAIEWLAGSSIGRNFSLPQIERQLEANRLAQQQAEHLRQLISERKFSRSGHRIGEHKRPTERP